MRLLLKKIKQLATPVGNKLKKGSQMSDIKIMEDVDVYIENGKFREIGKNLAGKIENTHENPLEEMDCENLVATPGIVDPHTHIPFAGERHREFYLRQQGKTYIEILNEGGGIINTTKAVRNSSEDEMMRQNLEYAMEMFSKGVVVFEGKSGYGLDTESEIKQLKVLYEMEKLLPQKIVKTFLGPHALAPEFDDYDTYMNFINDKMLPIVYEEFGEDIFVDVFCEKGVFGVEQSRKYLEKAKEFGFKLKMHADEIEYLGGSVLGAEMGAKSVDHLIAIEQDGIEALSSSDTVAVMLPGTSFFLGKPFAPARKLIDSGAAVALASDFNPGSCTFNDPHFVAHLASAKLGMSPEEILTAQTLNAAAALDIAQDWGSIEIGKNCGMILWDISDYRFVPYFPGHNIINTVVSPYLEGEHEV